MKTTSVTTGNFFYDWETYEIYSNYYELLNNNYINEIDIINLKLTENLDHLDFLKNELFGARKRSKEIKLNKSLVNKYTNKKYELYIEDIKHDIKQMMEAKENTLFDIKLLKKIISNTMKNNNKNNNKIKK